MAPSPGYATDHTLFLTRSAELWRSTDNGANWSLIYTAADSFFNLAISPNFLSDRTLMLSTGGKIIRVSRDGGATFSTLNIQARDMAVAARPAMTPAWYFFNEDQTANTYRLLVSTDGGLTLASLYGGGLQSASSIFSPSLTAAPADGAGISDLYVAGLLDGLYGSSDGGFSFSERDRGITAYKLYNLSSSGQTLVTGGQYAWFKSVDGGANWARFAMPPLFTGELGLTVLMSGLSPDYANDRTLFLGSGQIGRSADGGQSFSLAASVYTHVIVFAPGFSGGNGTIFAGTQGGLSKSTDGGRSFAAVVVPNACLAGSPAIVHGLAISPNYSTDQTLFMSGYGDGTNGGLCRSSDGGATWTQLTFSGRQLSGQVAVSPTYFGSGVNGTPAKTVLVGDEYGFYRSTDGGATWAAIAGQPTLPKQNHGLPVFSPSFDVDGTAYYIMGDSYMDGSPAVGVWRSSDFGATVAPLGGADQLLHRNVTGLAFLPGFDGRNSSGAVAVAATNGNGLWRSTDGGRSFFPVAGMTVVPNEINALARAPGGVQSFAGSAPPPGALYAATAFDGIHRSDDNGATFTPISQGLPASANSRAIVVPTLAQTAPVTAIRDANGNPQGLWSFNGTAWVPQTGTNLSATGAYTSFLEDGTYLYATRADGVSVRSGDGGATWTAQDAAQTDLVKMDYNPQLTPTFMSDPAVKTRGPAANFTAAVTASLWGISQSAGPRYSTTSGAAWIATPGANDYVLPGGQTWSVIRALGINATTGSREVVAGSTTNLYRSIDGGATWKAVSGSGSGLEATSKNFSAVVSTATAFGTTDLLVGATGSTTGGVYLSGDGGEHWTQVNQGFDPNNLSISSLITTSCSGCPVQYYSGSYGGGLYTRTVTVVAPPVFPATLYSCYGSTACSCATGGGSGPEQGGQAFKLCGSNFQSGAVIEFDGVPVYTNYGGGGCTLSPTQIVCNAGASGTPAHAPGLASIRVRNPDTRIGYLPAQYTYTGGTARASNLHVAKSSVDAALTWSCASCAGSNPARVYRSQNALFSTYLENYNGGIGGAYSNTGAVATAQSYFWTVE